MQESTSSAAWPRACVLQESLVVEPVAIAVLWAGASVLASGRDGVLRLRPSSVPPCHPSNARCWVWQRPAAHNEARHPFAAVSDKAVLGKGASSVRGQ